MGGGGWVCDPDGVLLARTSPAVPHVTVDIDLARARVASPVVSWIRMPLGSAFEMTIAHERRHLQATPLHPASERPLPPLRRPRLNRRFSLYRPSERVWKKIPGEMKAIKNDPTWNWNHNL